MGQEVKSEASEMDNVSTKNNVLLYKRIFSVSNFKK
jgi:hypothetical protein